MRKREKIIIIGGLVGVVLGVLFGVMISRRHNEDEAGAAQPNGKALLSVGMSLVGLVRLIQQL